MPLVITAIGVVILLILIMKLKVNTFISLAIVSFLLALALGIPLNEIVGAIETGMGGTLGSVGLIFGFGAILGKLIADGGGAQRISGTLIDIFGEKKIQWAVVLTAFILGIALFFEVGLVLLIPIVYQISKQVNVSFLYLGLPMTTALSVTHAFLPPHPGPTVIAGEYGADIGMVLLYGFIISIPTVLIAGPIFTKYIRKLVPEAFEKVNKSALASIGDTEQMPVDETPSFLKSAITALFPVILMGIATVTNLLQETTGVSSNVFFDFVALIGTPTTTMFISLLLAIYTMGISQNRTMTQLMKSAETSVKAISMILLILGISGSLKEVLIVGGVGDYVAQIFEGSALSPLFLAWLIAALMRVAQGSATVAALTTAGLVIPLMEGTDVNLALMVLATGAGSVVASHVNDTGFWIVKESFGLTVKETFYTWTALETIISVCGLVFVLLLSIVV